MYATTETGLAPEIVSKFKSRRGTREGVTQKDFEPKGDAAHYLLRPEGEDSSCNTVPLHTIFVLTMIYHSSFLH